MGLTEDEKAAVKRVRAAVPEVVGIPYDTDYNILRFIQGHGEENGAITLRNTLRSRKFNRIGVHFLGEPLGVREDRIKDDVFKFIVEDYPIAIFGTTGKDNRILVIEPCGRCDALGLKHSVTYSRFIQFRLGIQDRILGLMMEQERLTGQQSSSVYILDLDHLQFNKQTVEIALNQYVILWQIIFEFYPEWVGTWIMINAPSWMSLLWRGLSPLIAESTHRKLRLLKKDEDWKGVLLEYVDRERLPSYYGGTLDTGGDPMGIPNFPDLAALTSWTVKESHFWQESEKNGFVDELDVYNIPAGKTMKPCQVVRYEQSDPGMVGVIKRFSTHKYRFAAYVIGDSEERIPWERDFVMPNLESIDQVDVLLPLGKFEIHLTNPNWIWALEVRLLVSLLEGRDESLRLLGAKVQ